MKAFRTIVAALAVAAFTILAQTLLTMGASSAETVPTPAAPANIGIIDSSAFTDEKTGITRAMAAMQQLNKNFEPMNNELRGMRERLNTMRSDLQKKRGIQDARISAQQADEAERLEIQIKRKAEDAQTSYRRESLAVLEPLQKDIITALNAYAQAKGITLVLDANRIPIIYAASSLDITRDFINEYNRTHPAGPVTPTRTTSPARPATSPARPTASPARPTRP
jgi:Skp family chaperone for outer membrane proteins